MGREEIQWEGGQRGAWQRHRAGGTWWSQNNNYTWRSTCLLEVCTLLSLIAYGYLFSQAELLIEELGWFLCRSWRNQIFWRRITLLKSNGTLLCPLRPPRRMQAMMNWIPLGRWNGLEVTEKYTILLQETPCPLFGCWHFLPHPTRTHINLMCENAG